MPNHLYYGDNLQVLRDNIPDESVDLIYLDPPFNSNASYNVLFRGPKGNESAAQIEAFDDTWIWGEESENAYDDVRNSTYQGAADMLTAMYKFLGKNDMMAYLTMMAVRLIELHRVLKPTGSLYLHCDPTASHYLKILLDAVFGPQNYKNEITWKRTSTHNDPRQFGRISDTILFYSKSKSWIFNVVHTPYSDEYINKFFRYSDGRGRYQKDNITGPGINKQDPEWNNYHPQSVGRSWSVPKRIVSKLATKEEIKKMSTFDKLELLNNNGYIEISSKGTPRFKSYLEDLPVVPAQSIWTDITPLTTHAKERLGYPTQKPVALLERIINASSNEGDVILDPFCGCGTTVHASEKLGRKWIGIDVTHLAIGLIEKRLRESFANIKFETHGVPQDIAGARDLAERDKWEFERWASMLINAQIQSSGKKGGDGGIDGVINFGKTERAIVSIKGGKNLEPAMIRDLVGTVEREEAEIGVFLSLYEPTSGMVQEAAKAGMYRPENGAPVPKVQVVTIEQAMDLRDRSVRLPLRIDNFKKAKREQDMTAQGKLDI